MNMELNCKNRLSLSRTGCCSWVASGPNSRVDEFVSDKEKIPQNVERGDSDTIEIHPSTKFIEFNNKRMI